MKLPPNIPNYLALYILDYLGNQTPTNEQIQFVENLLGTFLVRKTLVFDSSLTPREQTCLFFAALGNTVEQTADLMNVEVSTVASYRKSIIKKLGANNMPHAILLGVYTKETLPEKLKGKIKAEI